MSLPGETFETLLGTCLFSGSSHSLCTPPAPFHGLLFYLPRLLVTTIWRAFSSGIMSIHLCIPVVKHWACNWRLHKWQQLSLTFLGGHGGHNCLLNWIPVSLRTMGSVYSSGVVMFWTLEALAGKWQWKLTFVQNFSQALSHELLCSLRKETNTYWAVTLCGAVNQMCQHLS